MVQAANDDVICLDLDDGSGEPSALAHNESMVDVELDMEDMAMGDKLEHTLSHFYDADRELFVHAQDPSVLHRAALGGCRIWVLLGSPGLIRVIRACGSQQRACGRFRRRCRQGGKEARALLPVLLQQSQPGNSQAANSSKHLQVSTSFQPSRQWLSVVWLEAMRLNIGWAHRYMSTVKGRFWCMDRTFATARRIRDAEQQAVYKAVLTVVNEHSQLVAQRFTHTTSLYEVRKGLQLLRDRYKGEDIEVRHTCNFLYMLSTSQLHIESLWGHRNK